MSPCSPRALHYGGETAHTSEYKGRAVKGTKCHKDRVMTGRGEAVEIEPVEASCP